MSNTPIMTQMIVRSVLNKMDRRNRQQPQLKNYDKTTVFKARGGAWLMIVFCGLVIAALMLYGLICDPDFLMYVVGLYCIVVFIFILRKSISMLKAQIIVGPEALVLDGAIDYTKKRKKWYWMTKGLETSDLMVEIPWNSISLLATVFPTLVVKNYAGECFLMELGYFDMKVTREISKYHKIEETVL